MFTEIGTASDKLPEELYLLPCSFLLLRRPYCNPNQFWSFNQNSNGLKFPGFWKSWKNIWMKLDFFPGFPGSWKFWTKLQKNFIWSWVVKDIMISCERAPQNTLCAKKWEKSIRGKIVLKYKECFPIVKDREQMPFFSRILEILEILEKFFQDSGNLGIPNCCKESLLL